MSFTDVPKLNITATQSTESPEAKKPHVKEEKKSLKKIKSKKAITQSIQTSPKKVVKAIKTVEQLPENNAAKGKKFVGQLDVKKSLINLKNGPNTESLSQRQKSLFTPAGSSSNYLKKLQQNKTTESDHLYESSESDVSTSSKQITLSNESLNKSVEETDEESLKSAEREHGCMIDPYELYMNAIRGSTPIQNRPPSVLHIELEDQANRYYTKNRPSFMKIVSFDDYDTLEDYTTHDDFEAKHENSFKAIFKFSRAQAKKLNRRSRTPEPDKLNRDSFCYKKENSRLNKILDVRHLGFSKNDTNLSDDDEEIDEMKIKSNNLEIERFRKESEKFQDNIYEHFAKKYNTRIQEYQAKTSLIKTMHSRAKINQANMQGTFSPDGKIMEKRTPMSMTTPRIKSNRSSTTLDLTYSTNTILSDDPYNEPQTPLHDQQKDFYRNLGHSFRIDTNPITLAVHVFKSPLMMGYEDSKKPIIRSKSVMSAYRSQSSAGTSSYSPKDEILESSRLSNKRPMTAIDRKSISKMSNIPKVPISYMDLNDRPLIRAKCLSTLWKNY